MPVPNKLIYSSVLGAIKAYLYILECADGSYYTGSTVDLLLRLEQHQMGTAANYTRKRLPVKLVYTETFDRIEEAFNREKQIQGWSRRKKEALISGHPELLPTLAATSRAAIDIASNPLSD